MNISKRYTHHALSNLLGVSVTTIKSYRRKFPDCIPVANQGKPIRFDEQARDVCLRIRDLFATGMSVPEVRAHLTKEFDWISPESPGGKTGPALQIELPPLYTSAMSDMAQSLVGLAQKQGTVLTRLEELGSALNTGQTEGIYETAAPAATQGASVSYAPQTLPEAEHPAWPDEFAALFRQMAGLAGRLEACADRLEVLMAGLPPLSPPIEREFGTPAAPQETERPARRPDRPFMLLPLVVTGADGLLHGITGQGHRFTCADLEALAACPANPKHACTLEWSESGADWRLSLRGRDAATLLAMAFLREVSDNAGHTAVLLHSVRILDEERNPVEFMSFLRNLEL